MRLVVEMDILKSNKMCYYIKGPLFTDTDDRLPKITEQNTDQLHYYCWFQQKQTLTTFLPGGTSLSVSFNALYIYGLQFVIANVPIRGEALF